MTPDRWTDDFRRAYAEAESNFRNGCRAPDAIVSSDTLEFLASIGCSAQELFDFVEDGCNGDDPPFETTLLITAIRRDHFLRVLGAFPFPPMASSTLPPKSAELDGVRWLPRLIEKARRKLHGSMDHEIMYCCGGDRAFFREHGIHPADFLLVVRDHWQDDAGILRYVRSAAARIPKDP